MHGHTILKCSRNFWTARRFFQPLLKRMENLDAIVRMWLRLIALDPSFTCFTSGSDTKLITLNLDY